MLNKPIFVATHPRSCSTAFERVFMTRRDALQCIHEPFGDAFYYGPERLSSRYEKDEQARLQSNFAQSTFRAVLDRIEKEGAEDKRIFIKDIIHYLVPPNGAPPSIAPSLARKERGIGTFEPRSNCVINGAKLAPYPYGTEAEPGNPTVVPSEILGRFHFTFLIRHPRYSIPSYYRCTVPPLDDVTGFYNFMPSEAGYDELRRVFDYLRAVGQVGPRVASRNIPENIGINGNTDAVDICVVDADDLLDDPVGIITAYCNSVGIEYHEQMLRWDSQEDQKQASDAFAKWKGFHEDALNSRDLKPRTQVGNSPFHLISRSGISLPSTFQSICQFRTELKFVTQKKKKAKSDEEEDREWLEKFGAEGAKVIRQTVNANVKDYEYLKQFALTA